MKEVSLPSGNILKITLSPFAESKALFQAILDEFKGIKFNAGTDVAEMIKEAVCTGFSSKKIETCLDVCFKRCLYNDLKIDINTFEPVDNRQDYIPVCVEVIKENTEPFLKSLFAESARFMSILPSIPA